MKAIAKQPEGRKKNIMKELREYFQTPTGEAQAQRIIRTHYRKQFLFDVFVYVALLSCLVLFALLMVRTHLAAVEHQQEVNERQDALTVKALEGKFR